MIRPATELDLLRLDQLAEAYSKEAKHHGAFPYNHGCAMKNVAVSMLSDSTFLYVLVSKGTVVGFLWATLSTMPWSEAKIVFDNILYISPENRGGYPVISLIRTYERWAKSNGAVSAMLSTASGIDTERTIALYEKLGYKHVGSQFMKEL